MLYDHHSIIVLRGLRGALDCFPTMPRDASLSENYKSDHCFFFHSKTGIDFIFHLSENFFSIGILFPCRLFYAPVWKLFISFISLQAFFIISHLSVSFLLKPKSVILRCPRRSSSRFSGFTSLYTMARACRYARAIMSCAP